MQVAIQAPVVQDERTKKLLREYARLIRKILARKSGHRCSKMTKTKKAAYMIPAVAEQYDVHPQTLRLLRARGSFEAVAQRREHSSLYRPGSEA